MRFLDRREAGARLSALLGRFAGRDDVIVLGLPRGGVPVAFEVARALRAPLDVCVVRKLGAPGQEELAIGALASGGTHVVDDAALRALDVSAAELERITAHERAELERRERAYRGARPAPDVRGRTVIVVDDGLATGASMLAAVRAIRAQAPARIVVAVPVAPPESCARVRRDADECVCVAEPEAFFAVGAWYADFSQTTDAEVQALLEDAHPAAP